MAIGSNLRPAELFQLQLAQRLGGRRQRRSPTLFSALADALRTAGGAYMGRQITQGAQDRREAANKEVMAMLMGKPAVMGMVPRTRPAEPSNYPGSAFALDTVPKTEMVPGITTPAVSATPEQLMAAALNPDIGAQQRQIAEMLYKNSLPKPKEDFTLAANAIRVGADGKVIASNPKPIEKASTPLIIEAQQLYPNDAVAQQNYVLNARKKTPADNTPTIVREAKFVHPGDPEAQRKYVERNSQKSRALVNIQNRKAPPGMQFVPDPANPGAEMLEPIKGGKQYLAARQARLSASLTFNNMMFAITELEKKLDAGENITGVAGVFLSNLPQTEATNAKALISTIKANLGFKELGKMRASSPTGAGLGNVTEREIQFLQATVANLDQAQTVEQFRKALNKIRKSTMFQRMFELYGENATSTSVTPEVSTNSVYNPASGQFEPKANKGAGR